MKEVMTMVDSSSKTARRSFYNSVEWRDKREAIRARDNYEQIAKSVRGKVKYHSIYMSLIRTDVRR